MVFLKLIIGWFGGQDDDCKWFQWIDDERTSREKKLCGPLLDKLKRNITKANEKKRLLQKQVRALEEKGLRRKKKILTLQEDYRCLMEANFQLKIKLHEKEIKFVRVLIMLGLSYFLLIVWLSKNDGSKFRYLALM